MTNKYAVKYSLDDDANNDEMAGLKVRRRLRKEHTRPNARNEKHDVFKRINMHEGDTTVCWEWNGAHNLGTRGERRPRVVIGGEEFYTYRVVWELYYGRALAHNEVVRHSCDNCGCCNPHHLMVGTQRDNVNDMLHRERIGLKMIHVKRIMQMLEIGADSRFVSRKMKEEHNLTLDPSVIRKIRMRRLYKHIPWPWGDAYAKNRKPA